MLSGLTSEYLVRSLEVTRTCLKLVSALYKHPRVLKQQRTCLVGKAIHTLPLLEARAKYCGETQTRDWRPGWRLEEPAKAGVTTVDGQPARDG